MCIYIRCRNIHVYIACCNATSLTCFSCLNNADQQDDSLLGAAEADITNIVDEEFPEIECDRDPEALAESRASTPRGLVIVSLSSSNHRNAT